MVPQLPSASATPPLDPLEADVQVLRTSITREMETGNDVLVLAHSYGGIPVAEALKGVIQSPSQGGHGKVLGIVFVSSMVVDEGESMVMARAGQDSSHWIRIEVSA